MISTFSGGAKINLSVCAVHHKKQQSKRQVAPFPHHIFMLDGYFLQLVSGFGLSLWFVTISTNIYKTIGS